MEIVTLVLSGQLEHRDNLGSGEVLHPGELQRMTAGTGIQHSEFNPSTSEPVHLYQIWILPEARGPRPQLRATCISRHRTSRSPSCGRQPEWSRGLACDQPGCRDLPRHTFGGRRSFPRVAARPACLVTSAGWCGRSTRRSAFDQRRSGSQRRTTVRGSLGERSRSDAIRFAVNRP